MKVCKFEKMKEEDEIRQVINYILKEHPYVVVVPTLTQLQEWLQNDFVCFEYAGEYGSIIIITLLIHEINFAIYIFA